MTKDEALRMALKSLEFYYDLWKEKVDAQTIAAIREALAQPEQEPVAVDCCANCLRPKHEHMGGYCPNPYTTVWHAWDYPFTPDATPPQRKPLTDEQCIDQMLNSGFERNSLGWSFTYGRLDYHLLKFARAIEAAHGIKE